MDYAHQCLACIGVLLVLVAAYRSLQRLYPRRWAIRLVQGAALVVALYAVYCHTLADYGAVSREIAGCVTRTVQRVCAAVPGLRSLID